MRQQHQLSVPAFSLTTSFFRENPPTLLSCFTVNVFPLRSQRSFHFTSVSHCPRLIHDTYYFLSQLQCLPPLCRQLLFLLHSPTPELLLWRYVLTYCLACNVLAPAVSTSSRLTSFSCFVLVPHGSRGARMGDVGNGNTSGDGR